MLNDQCEKLESHGMAANEITIRLELENNCPVEDLAGWFKAEQPNFDVSARVHR